MIVRALFHTWLGGFAVGMAVATVVGAAFEFMGWGKDGFR